MIEILESQLPITIDDQLMLRYISEDDKEALYEMYRNENISKYVARNLHTSLKDTEEFIQTIKERMEAGNNLYLGICETSSQKLIGIIRFLKKDDPDTLTLGYALNESFWGRGIVPKAMKKLIEIIKLDERFKRLRATVKPENTKSQRCLEKLGFELSGRFMKKEVLDGLEVEGERLEYIK